MVGVKPYSDNLVSILLRRVVEGDVWKASCCIYGWGDDFKRTRSNEVMSRDTNKWYYDTNGKFYWD